MQVVYLCLQAAELREQGEADEFFKGTWPWVTEA